MFKVSGGISSKIINEIFQFREKITYEFRLFIISIYFHSVCSGSKSLEYGRWCLIK